MPKPLTNPEMNVLEQDTAYLEAGMDPGQSFIVDWGGRFVLIYRAMDGQYYTTDVSDLSQAVLAELQKQTPYVGALASLGFSLQRTISDDVEAVLSVGGTVAQMEQSAAAAVGNTLAAALTPVVGSLTVPLVIVGVILALMYLPKPRG